MKFEEMKKIWDTQSQEPYYAIDEATLHLRIIKQNAQVKQLAGIAEWGMFIIMTILAIVIMIDGVLNQEYYHLPEGVILLFAAGHIYRGRKKRISYQGTSDRSILGDLRQAIRTLDYHIQRQRNFIWWFIFPVACTVGIDIFFTYEGKPWWIWPLVLISFVFAYWLVNKELQVKILPRRADLEALLHLLEKDQ